MRTRRQDKAAAAAAAAEKEETPSPSKAVSFISDDDDDHKDAQTSATPIAISKVDGPAPNHTESKPRSKLPTAIQFPLVAILSLAISELGYSLSWSFTQGVLAAHARLPGTGAEMGAIMGWRLCVSLLLHLLQPNPICGWYRCLRSAC